MAGTGTTNKINYQPTLKTKLNKIFTAIVWTTYAWGIVLFILIYTLWYSTKNGSGFWTDDNKLKALSIVTIVLSALFWCLIFVQVLLNRVFDLKSKKTYVYSHNFYLFFANLYGLIIGLVTKSSMSWVTKGSEITVGGWQMIALISLFAIFIIWKQLDFFWGTQIKSFVKKSITKK